VKFFLFTGEVSELESCAYTVINMYLVFYT